MTVTIQTENPLKTDIQQLLQTHLDFAKTHTPIGSGHALSPTKLEIHNLTFYTARINSELVGCIALKQLNTRHGEIKAMHVIEKYRKQGIAKKLIASTITESQKRGYKKLSLETGGSKGFEASRLCYQNMGFKHCKPFGNYKNDPSSYCMTKTLQ